MLKVLTLAIFLSASLSAVTETEAHFFVQEAYRAGYPLVGTELIRKQMTEGPLRKIHMGEFLHERAFPVSDSQHSRWTNMDMLYSTAWLDLTKEPYFLNVPQFDGRVFLFPVLSAWNEEVFLIKKPGKYALVGPSFKGSIPKGWKIIRSPTSIAFIPGRIFSSGTLEDLEKVHELQDALVLKPASFDENDTLYTLEDDNEPEMTDKLIEKTLKSSEYFTLLAKALKRNQPTKDKERILQQLARVGIIPGKPFDIGSLDPNIAKAMEVVTVNILSPNPKSEEIGSWSYSFKEGGHGADFIRRAISTSVVLGDVPQETIHLYTDHDEVNKKLDGAERYILHISKEKLPKVKGTWSLTAYNDKGELVQNPLNRHTVHREGVNYNPDGSLDIFIQNRYPGKVKEANWLPTPDGKFILVLRLYQPENEITEKNWRLPGIKKEYF